MAPSSFLTKDSLLDLPQVAVFDSSDKDQVCVLHPARTYPASLPLRIHREELLPHPLESLLAAEVWHADPSYIARLSGGGLISGFFPVSQGNILFRDLSVQAGRHLTPSFCAPSDSQGIVASLDFRRERRVQGSAARLFFHAASGLNHSHWLLQTLPKVLHYRVAGISPDYYTVSPEIQPYQRETLALLGIDERKLLFIEPDELVRFDTLYSSYTPNVIDPECQIYRECVERCGGVRSGPERLYVSRLDARNVRRLINEREIEDVARSLGFTIVTPSSCSPSEEISLFRQARIVVGPIGAGLYNLLFSEPGAHLVVLADPSYVMDWPLQVASLMGHTIEYLFGNSFLSWEPIHRGTHNNWVLDPELVRTTLLRHL